MHNKNYRRDLLIYDQRTNDNRTLESIGKEHGITKERVRQILRKEKRHMEWLKHNRPIKDLVPLIDFLRSIADGG